MKKYIVNLFIAGLLVSKSFGAVQWTPISNTIMSYDQFTNVITKMFPSNYWSVTLFTNVYYKTNRLYNVTNALQSTNYVTRASNLYFSVSLTNLNASYLFGNLRISNFNAGSGASGSTFWAGDGTWKDPLATSPLAPYYTNVSTFSGTIPYCWKSNTTTFSNAFIIINGRIYSTSSTNWTL